MAFLEHTHKRMVQWGWVGIPISAFSPTALQNTSEEQLLLVPLQRRGCTEGQVCLSLYLPSTTSYFPSWVHSVHGTSGTQGLLLRASVQAGNCPALVMFPIQGWCSCVVSCSDWIRFGCCLLQQSRATQPVMCCGWEAMKMVSVFAEEWYPLQQMITDPCCTAVLGTLLSVR